jgi:hypothetical protein
MYRMFGADFPAKAAGNADCFNDSDVHGSS